MSLFGLLRRRPYERTGFELYGAAVAAARAPEFYAELGVPDTAAGRFELVSLHVGVLIRRLRAFADKPAQELAQSVFDAMFSDMDVNLREMGIGDLSVGKRVKQLWEGFHGRAQAYAAALDAGDVAGLEAALGRNVWAGHPPPEGAPAALAARARAMAAVLERQGFADFTAGKALFA
jgi:cytochrome b pre-mRNA-processing protein 3